MKRKFVALAALGVLAIGAGTFALTRPEFPPIPTIRPERQSDSLIRDPFQWLGSVKLEKEPEQRRISVRYQHSCSTNKRYHETEVRVREDGTFQGKYFQGQLEFVSTVFQPYSPNPGSSFETMRPYRLDGSELTAAEQARVATALAAFNKQGIERFQVNESSSPPRKRTYQTADNFPGVVSLLQITPAIDQKRYPRGDFSFYSLEVENSGNGRGYSTFWDIAGSHALAELTFPVWHDAGMKLGFGLPHEAETTLEIPFQPGAKASEGDVGAVLLDWVEWKAVPRLVEDFRAKEPPYYHMLARLDPESSAANEGTTTALLLSNVREAPVPLEGRALIRDLGWIETRVEGLDPLYTVQIEAPPGRIERLSFHWAGTQICRILVDIPRLPGMPEENRGVTDLTKVKLPRDLRQLDGPRTESLITNFFDAEIVHGKHYNPSLEAKPSSVPATEWITGADVLRHWNTLSGGAGVRVKNGGRQIELGPARIYDPPLDWIKEKTGW